MLIEAGPEGDKGAAAAAPDTGGATGAADGTVPHAPSAHKGSSNAHIGNSLIGPLHSLD